MLGLRSGQNGYLMGRRWICLTVCNTMNQNYLGISSHGCSARNLARITDMARDRLLGDMYTCEKYHILYYCQIFS